MHRLNVGTQIKSCDLERYRIGEHFLFDRRSGNGKESNNILLHLQRYRLQTSARIGSCSSTDMSLRWAMLPFRLSRRNFQTVLRYSAAGAHWSLALQHLIRSQRKVAVYRSETASSTSAFKIPACLTFHLTCTSSKSPTPYCRGYNAQNWVSFWRRNARAD